MPQSEIIVFTDLDGTLLDHASYSHAPARPALERLRRAGIPLVLASSKTADEMIPLRAELGFEGVPMICENGAGIVWDRPPEGDGYARLRAALDALPDALRRRFEGFGDMDPARISKVTGLPEEAARRAARRLFSEPGLWHGSAEDEARFVDAAKAAGLAAQRGGRFLTLGPGAVKADRMAEIAGRYGHPVTIALGDAPNDAGMLAAADHGFLLANPHAPPVPELPGEREGRIRRLSEPGPEGWNLAVNDILDRLRAAA